MLEQARDSLASGIRVANKTLGGLLDMQDWRQYASGVMGQASDLGEGGRGLSGEGHRQKGEQEQGQGQGKEGGSGGTTDKQSFLSAEEAVAVAAQREEERRHSFLCAVLSPPVRRALAEEEAALTPAGVSGQAGSSSTDKDKGQGKGRMKGRGRGVGLSAQSSLQQAVRNLRFLGDYDDSFLLPDEGHGGGKGGGTGVRWSAVQQDHRQHGRPPQRTVPTLWPGE